MPSTLVAVVDDHEVVRRGIAEVIDRSDGLRVVGEAGSVAEAVRRMTLVRPAVLLVDLQLPDGTGLDLISAAARELPDARCIVLTSFDDDEAVSEALALVRDLSTDDSPTFVNGVLGAVMRDKADLV